MENLNIQFEIASISTEINRLLPQLAEFISQFHKVVADSGINVITDSVGNLSMDSPQSMSESELNKIGTRIGIIDRLINTNGNSINELFQKGLSLEESIRKSDPGYNSLLSEQIAKFKALNASYKH